MHESLGDRRKEVHGARFIYFVKQLHNNLSLVRRLPQESLFHEPVTFLEVPQKKAEIQREALRRGKNLTFSEDTCLEKKENAVEGNPKKSWSGIKTEGGVEYKEVWLEVRLMESH